jgi:hypothetical protein
MTGIITTEYLPDNGGWKVIITYPDGLKTHILGCESKSKAKKSADVMLNHYRKTNTIRVKR